MTPILTAIETADGGRGRVGGRIGYAATVRLADALVKRCGGLRAAAAHLGEALPALERPDYERWLTVSSELFARQKDIDARMNRMSHLQRLAHGRRAL